MTKFYETGLAYKQAGGKFKAVTGPDGRLLYAIFSRPEAADFISEFQDLILLDGTHNTNVYDYRLMPLVMVDSLGYSMIIGVMLAPAESTAAVTELFDFFEITDCKNYTTMTDEGGAFVAYCGSRDRPHLLCAHHFQQKAVPAAASMPKELRDSFMVDVSYLLYSCWKSIENDAAFEEAFTAIKLRYDAFDLARTFLADLDAKKLKVISYYTQRNFTAGAFSTGRSESINAMLKGWSEFKKKLANFNIVQIFYWVDANTKNIMEKMLLSQLRDIVIKKKKWGSFSSPISPLNVNAVYSRRQKYHAPVYAYVMQGGKVRVLQKSYSSHCIHPVT